MDVTNSYSDPRSGVHLQLNKSSSRQSSTFSCRQWSSNSLQGRFALAWAPAEEVGHGDSVTRWLEYLAICNKETSPVMSKVCQSRLSILPNRKWTVKILPKICKVLPNWRNFAQSSHTAWRRWWWPRVSGCTINLAQNKKHTSVGDWL